jgi:hypothetical protein
MNAYLELADHPAHRIPYTPTDEIAIEYRIPSEKSVSARPLPKGTTAQPSRLNTRLITGARKNRLRVACCGITISLTTSLRASAKGCSVP